MLSVMAWRFCASVHDVSHSSSEYAQASAGSTWDGAAAGWYSVRIGTGTALIRDAAAARAISCALAFGGSSWLFIARRAHGQRDARAVRGLGHADGDAGGRRCQVDVLHARLVQLGHQARN